MRYHLFALVIFLVAATSEAATTRYIDNAGSGCSNGSTNYNPATRICSGGAQSTVYTTFANAFSAATTVAGDTLDVRAGTYVGFSTYVSSIPSGTAGNLITIKAHSGETVILTESAVSVVISFDPSSNVQYLSIEGFIVQSGSGIGTSAMTLFGSHHLRFINNEFRNAGQNCIQTGSHDNLYSGGSVHNCSLYAEFDIAPEGGAAHYGFYSSDINSIYENMSIYDIDPHGIPGDSSYRGYAIHAYPSVQGNHYRGLTIYNSDGLLISQEGGFPASFNNRIYNNVIYGNRYGISIQYSSGNLVYNNTVYNNSISGIDTTPFTSTAQVKNNIIANNGTNIVTGGGVTFSNNMCTSAGGTTNCALVRTLAQIAFVNATGPIDLRLQSGSQAIDQGTTSIASGVTIPACPTGSPYCYNGTVPDVGYFETSGMVFPTVSINQPAGCAGSSSACTTSSSAITLTGTATTVTSMTRSNNRGGGAIAITPGTSWATGTNAVALFPGLNTITVTATNTSGSVIDVIDITYAPTYPGDTLSAALAFESNGTDSSGNSNTASLVNSPAYVDAKFNKGVSLSPANFDYINVPHANNTLDFTQSFTIALWLNIKPHTDFRAAVVKNTDYGYAWALYASQNSYCSTGSALIYLRVNGTVGPDFFACSSQPLPVNQPVHLAATYSNSAQLLKIFVDGAEAQSVTASGYMEPQSTSTITIGRSAFFGEYLDANWVDEVHLNNFALPVTAASNVTPNATCSAQNRADQNGTDSTKWSIIGAMNCSIISPVPPLTNKMPAAASSFKVQPGIPWKWSAQ